MMQISLSCGSHVSRKFIKSLVRENKSLDTCSMDLSQKAGLLHKAIAGYCPVVNDHFSL